jgi:uracil-DNA glycosylase
LIAHSLSFIKNTSWQQALEQEFKSDNMQQLRATLAQQRAHGAIIYPPQQEIFSAFELTPLDKLKVVILGQDPYHGPNQAQGLSFSVPATQKIPPSLKNIYKELHADLNIPLPTHGYLGSWAQQGVLLLNSILTVEQGKPGSHQNLGWQIFTDKVIKIINAQDTAIIFLLWGAYAQSKAALIDPHQHIILKAAHPSPFSAYRGFLGCKHFSTVNKILRSTGRSEINWASI